MTGAHDEPGDIEVVFLCTANQGRSPLAEQLLLRHVGGLPVRVRSRGLLSVGPAPALPEVANAAHELGVDLEAHRARALVPGELEDADLVIGFEPSHSAAAVVDGRADRDTVFTLAELAELLDRHTADGRRDLRARLDAGISFANGRRAGRDRFRAQTIEDPLGASPQTVARIAQEIASGVDRVASALFAAASSSSPPTGRKERAPGRRAPGWPWRGRGGSSGRLSR